MSQALLALALVITSSVPSFRRAGFGFTDKGVALHRDQLSKEQLAAIHKEPRLSVREVSAEDIGEDVDSSAYEAFMASAAAQSKSTKEEEKAAPSKTKSTPAKAGNKSSTAAAAENAEA